MARGLELEVEEQDSFLPSKRKDSVSLKHGNKWYRPFPNLSAPSLAGLRGWKRISAALCAGVMVLSILLSFIAHSREAHVRATAAAKGGRRPFIVLFGDSITEFAFDGKLDGWATALADRYVRTADVLNRGVSGYTTRDAIAVLDDVFPVGPGSPLFIDPPSLVTIGFGANDLVEHTSRAREERTVPLEEYKANLGVIVAHLRRLRKDLPLVFLTPPPTYDRERKRPNERSRAYGLAMAEVGEELNVPTLDVWSLLKGDEEEERGEFLVDGLHLNAKGNEQLALALFGVIAEHYEHLIPGEEYMKPQLPNPL